MDETFIIYAWDILAVIAAMSDDTRFIPNRLVVDYHDIRDIEHEFNIEFLETETVEAKHSSDQYGRLRRSETDKLFHTLVGNHGQATVEHIVDLFNCWKSDGYDEEAVQTYEALAKEALHTPGEVRSNGMLAANPSYQHKNCYEDLYRVTQAFVEYQFGDSQRIFRGVRGDSVASLVAQTIDKPDASRYYFETSSISNHTSLWSVAKHHSDGLIVTWDTNRERIAMAIDQLYHGPNGEDELQIAGGIIHVEPAGVLYANDSTNNKRYLQEIIQSVGKPWQMTSEQHEIFADLLGKMVEKGVKLRTREGISRVQRWEDAVQGQEPLSPSKQSNIKSIVDRVTTVE